MSYNTVGNINNLAKRPPDGIDEVEFNAMCHTLACIIYYWPISNLEIFNPTKVPDYTCTVQKGIIIIISVSTSTEVYLSVYRLGSDWTHSNNHSVTTVVLLHILMLAVRKVKANGA